MCSKRKNHRLIFMEKTTDVENTRFIERTDFYLQKFIFPLGFYYWLCLYAKATRLYSEMSSSECHANFYIVGKMAESDVAGITVNLNIPANKINKI